MAAQCRDCGMEMTAEGYWDTHCSYCGHCFGGVEVEYMCEEHCEFCCYCDDEVCDECGQKLEDCECEDEYAHAKENARL